METKPYSLQSPEEIAKDYGGNKQKIAQAMQMGIIDPTAGVLAGMFIDRMRSAQIQEAAPQASVAQQVMGGPPVQAPLAQAGGLGATAPAMPPMAPQGGIGAPPTAAPQAVPGMAEGGFVAPYMKAGGLGEVPLPDGLFDENRDGGYAGGGIIAFADGSPGEELPEIVATARKDEAPEQYYGYYRDPELMREAIDKLYKPERKQSKRLTEMFETELTPEAQKKRKKEDLWSSLAELGFGMAASKSPTFFGALGEAGAKAAPAMAARGKERRAEQRDAIKTLAQQEGLNNKEALDLAKLTMEGTDKHGQFDVKRLDREQRDRLTMYEQQMQNWRTQQQIAGGIRQAQISSSGQLAFLEKQDLQLQRQVAAAAEAQIPSLLSRLDNPIGKANNTLQQAIKQYGPNSQQAGAAYTALETAKTNHVNSALSRVRGTLGGGNSSGNPWEQNWGGPR